MLIALWMITFNDEQKCSAEPDLVVSPKRLSSIFGGFIFPNALYKLGPSQQVDAMKAAVDIMAIISICCFHTFSRWP